MSKYFTLSNASFTLSDAAMPDDFTCQGRASRKERVDMTYSIKQGWQASPGLACAPILILYCSMLLSIKYIPETSVCTVYSMYFMSEILAWSHEQDVLGLC